ncbi:MAG: hypothetical protein ACYC2O_02050 [Microthrixaceae bacterium]
MLKRAALAAFVGASVIGLGASSAGAQDSYQLPEDPRPVGDTDCVVFPRNHALHADISEFENTDREAVAAWAAQLDAIGDTTPVGWTVSTDNNSTQAHEVFGMPVNITDSTTPRQLFRLGSPRVEQVNPLNWFEGYMWRMLNGHGNLPDRAQIPVPAGAVSMPYKLPGVTFPLSWTYIEGDAPQYSSSDRHYLALETDECAAYETFLTSRPGAPGNASSLVNGGYLSFIADNGNRWDLTGVEAAYRDPGAEFGAFGYGTIKPFNASGNLNGTSHHESAAFHRFRSVDAAGTPLGAMVLRYDDVDDGPLQHALHMIISATLIKNQSLGVEWPAIYSDGASTDADDIPMGTWFRLELTDAEMATRLGRPLSTIEENILAGLRTHGMILADSTGPRWGVAIEPNDNWTAAHRQMFTSIDLTDFTALVDADDELRATTGPIASTFSTWFQIN